MRKVVVITGGGSGMGKAAIKYMDKEKLFIISGRTEEKLIRTCSDLKELGFDVIYKTCDTSDRNSVKELVKFAKDKGEITQVINAAGISPGMKQTPEKILRINALGTVYVDEEFSSVMKEGSVILNIASSSAYALPKFIIPKKAFLLAEEDEDLFLKKLIKRSNLAKGEYQKAGFAYSLSKTFVVWYSKKKSFDLGKKKIRVCSLSPGLISTDMGNLEEENGSYLIKASCENRMGTPDELGFAIASCADERNGYLAGFDVLVDGGATSGVNEFNRAKPNG